MKTRSCTPNIKASDLSLKAETFEQMEALSTSMGNQYFS